jgi:hypothetical protein
MINSILELQEERDNLVALLGADVLNKGEHATAMARLVDISKAIKSIAEGI